MTRVKVPPPIASYTATTPQACLETRPTPQTVYLLGVAVNLSAICRAANMDHGYMSRLFRGERHPSPKYLRRVAAALHMSADVLDTAFREQAAAYQRTRKRQ